MGPNGPKKLKGKIKSLSIGSHGYFQVSLSRDGKPENTTAHSLVMRAFVGECPDGMEVRHLDGCRTNCKLSNLAYGTYAENSADKNLHGTMQRGETSAVSKLTEALVRDIRRAWSFDFTNREISDYFNIHKATISNVVTGYTWSHI